MKVEYNKILMQSMAEETAQLAALISLASNQLRLMWLEESGKGRANMTAYQLHSMLELVDLKLLDRYETFQKDMKRAA
jgi:predicted alpha/beta superfamily hydrolase